MPEQEDRSGKDTPLHSDIRMLGYALGQAIQRDGGGSIFETVEQLRRKCKRLRSCTEGLPHASGTEVAQLQNEIAALDQDIACIVDACDLDTTIDVIRAFTVYFHLVNTAEQQHRIRRRHAHEIISPSTPQYGSLAGLVAFFKNQKLDVATLQRLLNQLSIELVFTAHPTEATRRSLIIKSSRLAELLEAYDHAGEMTLRQRQHLQHEIERIVTLLWRTDSVLHVRLQPLDEIKMGLYYLEEILYNAIPELYNEFEELLSVHYPQAQLTVPPFLRTGSWIGGDQDGNPHVGPETLLQALWLQRARVIEHYRASIEKLAQEYSQSPNYCAITPALEKSIARDVASMPDYDRELGPHAAQGPYRRKLSFMWKRLGAMLAIHAGIEDNSGSQNTAISLKTSYSQSVELLADLEMLRESLRADGEDEVSQGRLAKLIRQVQVFGFHFAALDVRQHSERHASALAELLRVTGLLEGDYRSLDETERVRVLENLLRDRSEEHTSELQSRQY